MIPHSKTAAPMGSNIGNGGIDISKAVVAQKYSIPTEIATGEYAANKLASRFRLSISTARVICHLAGIGGSAG